MFLGEGSIFFGFYDEVGGSPVGVAKKLFTDPLTVIGALVEGHDIAYLIWLGVPLLFLFVLSPGLAAVALPQLLANGLSDFLSMTDPRYHSVAAVIPFLIAATVFGIARISAPRRGLAAAAVLVCSATLAIVVAPWARAVGGVPLGGRPCRLRRPHRSSRGRRRARSERRAGHGLQHGRRSPFRSPLFLFGPAARPRRVGRDRPRGSVGRAARLADPHEASRRSYARSPRGSRATPPGRRCSTGTVSSSFGGG